MKNFEQINFNKRLGKVAAIIGISGLALTACDSYAAERKGKTAVERYAFDYDNYQGDFCFDNTPYQVSKVVVLKKDGKINVLPASPNLPALHFDGLNNTAEPLQPTDITTAHVLDSYGCTTHKDGSHTY